MYTNLFGYFQNKTVDTPLLPVVKTVILHINVD